MNDNMQRAKENVMKGEGYLHIKRLPKNTVKEMIDFLNNDDEFGGDWATGMKYIWDTFKGMLPPKDSQVIAELELIHNRLNDLEMKCNTAKQSAPKEKGKRMADGKLKGSEEK